MYLWDIDLNKFEGENITDEMQNQCLSLRYSQTWLEQVSVDVLNCTSHFIGAISLSNIFQVNQSRHHLTLCTWSGTPPAASVDLFRFFAPPKIWEMSILTCQSWQSLSWKKGATVWGISTFLSGSCYVTDLMPNLPRSGCYRFNATPTKIWVLRRFPTNNINSVNFVHFPIEQMEDIPDSCAHTYIFLHICAHTYVQDACNVSDEGGFAPSVQDINEIYSSLCHI